MLIYVKDMDILKETEASTTGVTLGAGLTLTDIYKELTKSIEHGQGKFFLSILGLN